MLRLGPWKLTCSAPNVSVTNGSGREFHGNGGEQRQGPWLCRRLRRTIRLRPAMTMAAASMLIVVADAVRRSGFLAKGARGGPVSAERIAWNESGCARMYCPEGEWCGGEQRKFVQPHSAGGNNTQREYTLTLRRPQRPAGSTRVSNSPISLTLGGL